MGREGVAYTFVTPEEGNELTRIEMRINRLLLRAEMPGVTSQAKPVATEPGGGAVDTGEPQAKQAARPVFGRPMRRVRRAL